MESPYRNLRMFNLRMDVAKMANGITPPVLRGYTMRAMKMGPSFQERNGDWRACCMKCQGAGRLDPNGVPYRVKHIDVRGRVDVCFSCDGKGFFPVPKPELYKEFLTLWLMEKVSEEKWKEILLVAESEVGYLEEMILISRESAEDAPDGYEVQVLPFWLWVLRRLESVSQGGPFFTSLDKKFQDRFNRLHKTDESLMGAYDAVMKILEKA